MIGMTASNDWPCKNVSDKFDSSQITVEKSTGAIFGFSFYGTFECLYRFHLLYLIG